MKLGHLIDHIKEKIAEYKKLMTLPHTSQAEHYEVNLEAQLSFADFEIVIAELEKLNPNMEAMPDHANLISDFFARRWNLIKSTDAIYLTEISSPINQCCLVIAKYLTEQTKLMGARHHLHLLMPTVESWVAEKSHNDLTTRMLHHFILNDANTRPIQLGFLGEKNEVDPKSKQPFLALTCMLHGKEVPLSKDETLRVRNHSPLLTNYYTAFTSKPADKDIQNPVTRAKFLADRDIQVAGARAKFVEALNLKDYGGQRVSATYDTAGRQRLHDNLMLRVNDLFKTREQLFDYIAKLPRSEWKGFMARLSNDQTFLNLFKIDGKEIDKSLEFIVNSKETFKEKNEIYNRAVLYCLVEAYWRDRKDKPEINNFPGRVSGFTVFGCSKTDKKSAVTFMLETLQDDGKCGIDEKAIPNDEKGRVAGAMKDGTLGVIFTRANAVLVEPKPALEAGPNSNNVKAAAGK